MGGGGGVKEVHTIHEVFILNAKFYRRGKWCKHISLLKCMLNYDAHTHINRVQLNLLMWSPMLRDHLP